MVTKKFFMHLSIYFLVACNLMGCNISINKGKMASVGKTVHEKKAIEKKDAEKVNIDLEMAAGELNIKEGSKELMQGEFLYNIPEWKPNIDYKVKNKEGKLNIYQPNDIQNHAGNHQNKWDLAFDKDTPIDMKIECGAVQSDIDLSKLNLKGLFVEAGVGKFKLDISGNYKQNLKVDIEGGVGDLEIYVPKDIGVKVNTESGIGSIKVDGLKESDEGYINESYGKTKYSMDLNVEFGVGKVEIKLKK